MSNQSQPATYWVLGASTSDGRGKDKYWPEFRDKGILYIEHQIGDLSQFDDQQELGEHSDDPSGSHHKTLWDFAHTMQIGDVVFIKSGILKILALGVVTSDYQYDQTRNMPKDTRHTRTVKWVHVGECEAERNLPQQALTGYTEEKNQKQWDWCKKMEQRMGEGNVSSVSKINNEEENKENPIIKKIEEILDYKKQVILYGPPGTGKTYWANEYVQAMFRRFNSDDEMLTDEDEDKQPLTEKEFLDEYVFRCTFHPEFGYEHFIQGFRPTQSGDKIVFERHDGIFKQLCDKARLKENQAKKYYLIIDEINRGDIPRIFGELITLIEKDKRGAFPVKLPLQKEGEEEKGFTVPDNVYIIATMNTADRSIALLDTALRRRFGFYEMKPEYYHFEKITIKGTSTTLSDWLKTLNDTLVESLKKSRSDVEHLRIGHSYFFPCLKDVSFELFERIIRYEIYPLLEEYCYEEKDAFQKLKGYIKESTGIDFGNKETKINENSLITSSDEDDQDDSEEQEDSEE